MYQVSCPGCGAPVKFSSTASVMAVCGFCRSTVVKEGDAVRDLGKMSALLEDFTPMQLGVTGRHDGVQFTAVGRVQLRYSAGLWNEWYLRFDDGDDGWLSDAGGLVTVARERKAAAAASLPSFDQVTVGAAPVVGGSAFTVAERRTAQLVSGEGELPFVVGRGWQARVVDLRRDAQFITLDYSFPPTVHVYVGRAYVDWSELSARGLRRPHEIKDAAGRFKGKTAQLACPSCGGALSFPTGQVRQLFCGACHAQLDVTGERADLIAKHEHMESLPSTLKLGARGTIDGFEYEVIGLQTRTGTVEGESFGWTEYLLFCPSGQPLVYLSETAEGWEKTTLVNRWPQAAVDSSSFEFEQAKFNRRWAYEARTTYAAGSFDWNVRVGDAVRIVEFHDDRGRQKLFAEQTEDELEWSRARSVSAAELRQWFGKGVTDVAREPSGIASGDSLRVFGWAGLVVLLLLNFGTLNDGNLNFFVLIGAAALVWLPIWLASPGRGRRDGEQDSTHGNDS